VPCFELNCILFTVCSLYLAAGPVKEDELINPHPLWSKNQYKLKTWLPDTRQILLPLNPDSPWAAADMYFKAADICVA